MLKDKIGKALALDPDYIEIISKRNNKYTRYHIDKKGGGKREILHPSKELKVLQRWLIYNIFNNFEESEFSYAYSKGDSIRKNALVHTQSKYILHSDIKNFFPSIKREMISHFFDNNAEIVKNLGLSEADIKVIMDICLYNGEYLVVGSVASPKIANLIMRDFDNELFTQISHKGTFKYTRYADDITISSGEYIPEELVNIIRETLEKFGFCMNEHKTYFSSKKRRRQVTGVVIDNNDEIISIGNKKYKAFQRNLYEFLIKGKGDASYLRGYLSYIKSINKNQYLQLKRTYEQYDKEGKIFY